MGEKEEATEKVQNLQGMALPDEHPINAQEQHRGRTHASNEVFLLTTKI